MSNFVFLIDANQTPMNPIHPAHARELMEKSKAAVFRLMHRVLTTKTWVKRLIKFAPIGEIRQELVRFDLQQLENPEISGIEYQQGELLGYEVREYLLNKWERKCTYCEVKDVTLQVEHVKPKASGGTNRISNLCLACDKCNKKKGTLAIKVFLAHKPELLKKIQSQLKAPVIFQ